MKRLLAWSLTLVMLFSMTGTALADTPVGNGDVVYDSQTADTNAYRYVDAAYVAGKENYLPYFELVDAEGNGLERYYSAGGKDGVPLYTASGERSALTLGDEAGGLDELCYHYRADGENARQAWSCTTDEIKAGWEYTDENDDTVYCVEDKSADETVNGFARLLFEGEIYNTVSYEPLRGVHLLYTAGGKDVDVAIGTYEAPCAACGKVIRYQKTHVTGGNFLYQDLTKEYADLLAGKLGILLPRGSEWITGCIYIVTGSSAVGSDIDWSLDETGTLTISGSGRISSYTDEEPAPWRENAADIRRVVIEDGVTAIGDNAFLTLRNLEEVTIADSVEMIGKDAFNSCRALRSVSLGEGLRELGEGAFGYCFDLAEITIPASVWWIGPQAFAGCTALTLRVAEGNEDYCCVDNVLFSKDMSRLVFCSNQKAGSYTVPSSVETIENSAFYYCVDLDHITIPDSVTEIGDNAFNQCGLREMTLPAGLTWIGESLFWGNRNLTQVTIPDGVTGIGRYAFSNCDELAGLRLPGSVETIEEYAFTGCSALRSVVLPAGMKTVGPYAFNECQALEEVVISGREVLIDATAFNGCHALKTVYYAGSAEQWAQRMQDSSGDGDTSLADAALVAGFEKGNLNGQGGEPDIADVQCLYNYLAASEMTGKYQDSQVAFQAAADVNDDGMVDVYDLQSLYESVSQ